MKLKCPALSRTFVFCTGSIVLPLLILGACGLKDFVGAQGVVKEYYLRRNMDMTRAAADAYKKHEGRYPENVEVMRKYFPGGQSVGLKNSKGNETVAPGSILVNSFTGEPEWPKAATLKNFDELKSLMDANLSRGKVLYIRLRTNGGYAIVGGGREDRPLRLILTESGTVRLK